MPEPWQHFYQSQRLRLAYWVWGDADKPPLLLVHGLRDHSRSWDRIAEAFCDQYRVVACDLRGHGSSEWTRGSHYELQDFTLDLVALIDLLGGRVSVVAHSMGGRVTLLTASAFPERFEKIVAIEGTGLERPALPRGPERLREWALHTRAQERREPRVYANFADAVARVQQANPRLSPETAEHLARWGAHAIDGGFVWKYDPWAFTISDLGVPMEEYHLYWPAITAPVLHIIGSEGVPRRRMRGGRPVESYFPDARTVLLPDSGHWVHHDQPAATIATIRDFLGDPPMCSPGE
ncbi:MAG: alpha/beta hydrolase [Dehalococcoidia bacterium]